MDIEILNIERLRYWCGRIDMPAPGVDVLANMTRRIAADAKLLQFFRAFHQKTVLQGEWHREYSEIPFDPLVVERCGSQASLFYLVAYLSALPLAEMEYQRRGIDLRIFHDTMQEITTWFCHEYDLTGVWEFKQFHWIWQSLSCVLFRLGRLQFILSPFYGGVKGFRKVEDGEILLLADPQLRLRTDGCAFGAGGIQMDDDPEAESGAWNALFEETPAGWRGHPVSPYGFVERTPVILPRAAWQLVLQQGDSVLDLHIPSKDSFSVDDCRESMRQAYDFFPRQFPDQPFKASFCHTWFFTPQLQQLLPQDSNLVRFQREFYLYPFPGGPGFLWGYVFGERTRDLASAPRDTSLRRAVLAWLEEGKELFDLPGVCFHAPEVWGSQPYMRRWDQRHLLPDPLAEIANR